MTAYTLVEKFDNYTLVITTCDSVNYTIVLSSPDTFFITDADKSNIEKVLEALGVPDDIVVEVVEELGFAESGESGDGGNTNDT